MSEAKPIDRDENRRKMQEKLAEEWKDLEVKIPFGEFAWLTIYQGVVPYIPPLIFGIAYVLLWVYVPQLTLLWILVIPFIFIGIYYIYIQSLSFFTNFFMKRWNKISPPEEGTFDRKFSGNDAEDERIQYYHKRGFMIKRPVFFSKKSMFPWTVHDILNKLGGNEIHPDAMYLDSFVGLEHIKLEPGFVGGDGIVLSSHVVDSIFGNLTIAGCHCEKNSVMATNSIMAPGSHLSENTHLVALSFAIKGQKSEAKDLYLIGIPAKQTDQFTGSFELANSYFENQTRKLIL
jgi:hypothetical protein